MANVTETSTWEEGIYQLETTDPLEGGSLGVLNYAIKGLANRTKWLYDAITVINAWIANTKFLLFLRKGTYTIGDAIGGDSIRTITFTSVGTSNYMVNGCLISKSADYNDDNDVIWMVREKTPTSFKLCLKEVAGEAQNLDFDYILIPL